MLVPPVKSPASKRPDQTDTVTRNPSHSSGDDVVPIRSLEGEKTDLEQSRAESDPHYEYLTFQTGLPPSYSTATEALGLELPDLRKYDSPFEWSNSRKNTIMFLSCCATFCTAYSAGSYSIASGPLRAKWGLSQVTFNLGVTTWATGFAFSPMFLAPLSEINGRRPIFLASGLMFFAAQIGCALTDSYAGMLVARFFVGAGGSTFATIVGGVVSDIYHADRRNTPMALYSGSALAGTGFGPLLSGFIVDRITYRWVFYHQLCSLGAVMLFMIVLFKETRGSVLLSRRAKAINAHLDKIQSAPDAPTIRYKVLSDEQRSSIQRLLYLSLTTPFKLLATEPVVASFSAWAAFAWAVLYMTFSVIPLVFTRVYHFDVEQNGAVFSAIAIGSILGTTISIWQEKIARRFWPGLLDVPEGRLYFACLESALLPIGLFWFGWTARPDIHWISPVIALGVAQVGIFSIYLAVFNYLADVYHRYASSALAGQSFCRNIMAAIFPLFTDIMFRKIGFGAASSLLGGVGALLTIVPWVLVFAGEKIRRRSRIASEIMEITAHGGDGVK
jgi:MFS family permease